MKYYIVLLITLLLGTAPLNAQTRSEITKTETAFPANGKYAMLVMKKQHLVTALQTGIELKHQHPGIDFQVLACGELVRETVLDAELQSKIKKAVNVHGLKVLACGLSVRQFSVDEKLLPEQMPVTANGLLYMLGLQEQGYKTLEL